MWEREAAESLGREGTLQGPQGTPSSKTIKSVQIILESLQRLNETLSYENADCITQLQHEGTQVIYTASYLLPLRFFCYSCGRLYNLSFAV